LSPADVEAAVAAELDADGKSAETSKKQSPRKSTAEDAVEGQATVGEGEGDADAQNNFEDEQGEDEYDGSEEEYEEGYEGDEADEAYVTEAYADEAYAEEEYAEDNAEGAYQYWLYFADYLLIPLFLTCEGLDEPNAGDDEGYVYEEGAVGVVNYGDDERQELQDLQEQQQHDGKRQEGQQHDGKRQEEQQQEHQHEQQQQQHYLDEHEKPTDLLAGSGSSDNGGEYVEDSGKSAAPNSSNQTSMRVRKAAKESTEFADNEGDDEDEPVDAYVTTTNPNTPARRTASDASLVETPAQVAPSFAPMLLHPNSNGYRIWRMSYESDFDENGILYFIGMYC
jgi:hypothetical protein